MPPSHRASGFARALLGAGVLAVLVVALSIVWTAVKSDYRNFVSGGQAGQIVTVDYMARFAKLYKLVGNLDLGALMARSTSSCGV